MLDKGKTRQALIMALSALEGEDEQTSTHRVQSAIASLQLLVPPKVYYEVTIRWTNKGSAQAFMSTGPSDGITDWRRTAPHFVSELKEVK